jgi:hypothetical protein
MTANQWYRFGLFLDIEAGLIKYKRIKISIIIDFSIKSELHSN